MDLPLYKTVTPEQHQWLGPVKTAEEFSTRTRVYQTPFLYDNVTIGDFYEIDVKKGVEFKADTGFLTITEDRPIAAVTVVGTGCVERGYNIVEWWDEGENIDNVENKTVKRLRMDNLNGIHPSVWIHILTRLPFLIEEHRRAGLVLDYDRVAPGDIKDDYDLLKKLTLGFYENLPLTFYENSVHFAVGHGPVSSYPKKVTIRCGCKGTEDAGTKLERYPGDYAIRLVQTHVISAAAS
jgi:hypothetical protein